MKQYHDLLEDILENGVQKGDRTTVGTLSVFGRQLRFDLQDGFPIVNTKPVWFKGIVVELLWFLRGDSNIKYLVDNGCNIWNEDSFNYYAKLCFQQGILRRATYKQFVEALKNSISWTKLSEPELPNGYTLGDTGKQYPWLWRHWEKITYNRTTHEYEDWISIDQISNLVEGLKNNPMSRRHIISAWNPATLDEMALPACHSFVQFNVRPNPKLSGTTYYLDCKFTMRSVDCMLGLPFNIASYALLTHIIARICDMEVGELICDLGDTHIYNNHIEASKEQLSRDPEKYKLPELEINEGLISDIECFSGYKDRSGYTVDELIEHLEIDDFTLINYQHYPKLESETKLNTGLK